MTGLFIERKIFYRFEIMDKELSLYNSYVIKGILANNEFGIDEVEGLESIRSFVFDFTRYREAGEVN
jgi:hypothetical protein